MPESILLTTVRVNTHVGQQPLTTATGFFFLRDDRLFLVSSRHVFNDVPTGHHPDRLTIELHTDPGNLAASTQFSIPLFRNSNPLWRQGIDESGDIDIAVIEIERPALPERVLYDAFTPDHLLTADNMVEVGTGLLVPGYPLGFHDHLHHLPVVRHAIMASSFGFRFQGQGYFLTDARTHRGTSGSPVVLRAQAGAIASHPLPWYLLGVHSSRLDVGTRDLTLDEALGLNCAWYADILLTLTQP